MNIEPAFLGLPTEVRGLVFEQLFTGRHVRRAPVKTRMPSDGLFSPITNIFLTSKVCYYEARPIFYRRAIFHLQRPIEPEDTGKPHGVSTGTLTEHATYIERIHCDAQSAFLVPQPKWSFPNLKLLQICLGSEFYCSDQMHFGRAMKFLTRYGDLDSAVMDRLKEEFEPGAVDLVRQWRELGLEKRGFKVTFLWRRSYRFLEFQGEMDIDEWILQVWDAEGNSRKVYGIPQNSLLPANSVYSESWVDDTKQP